MSSSCEASLANVVSQRSLKWVFVGGKGGVGKTTSSCALGVALAAARAPHKVLIVSTDPAHNLSDAFNQKFSRTPTAVRGFDNLFCMEIDAAAAVEEGTALAQAEAAAADGGADGGAGGGGAGLMAGLMKEFSTAVPGIDEAMSFMELMKHTKTMEFEVTVFDTAPTGHTLRLLALPGTLDRAMAKLAGLRDRFGGMISAVQGMMGGAAGEMPPVDVLFAKLDELRGEAAAAPRASLHACGMHWRHRPTHPAAFPRPPCPSAYRPRRRRAEAAARPRRDDLCLRVHPRVPLAVRDGAAGAGAHALRD